MKFTSLTTVIITAAAMTGIVIASAADGPEILCTPGKGGCISGYAYYNNGHDFGFTCGKNGQSDSWTPCSCTGCCKVVHRADGTTAGDCA
ncbi:hypothetical protein BD769DRAFT_1490022 [Suillus cothurnatus]|nr:hypothetical protein BD769DRAFT_1490022 [Suillus cothurnatus]